MKDDPAFLEMKEAIRNCIDPEKLTKSELIVTMPEE